MISLRKADGSFPSEDEPFSMLVSVRPHGASEGGFLVLKYSNQRCIPGKHIMSIIPGGDGRSGKRYLRECSLVADKSPKAVNAC